MKALCCHLKFALKLDFVEWSLSIRITIKTVPNTHNNVTSVEKRTYQEIRQVFGSSLCLYKNNVDVRDLNPFPYESVRFKIQ